jgi:peptidoglycan/LPS O-acetylase OafA/YrhL
MKKYIKVIFGPILGYLSYLLCDFLYNYFFPLKPISDLNTPGTVLMFEYLFYILWYVFVFIFQHKIIVPKTDITIKKGLKITSIVGLILALIFGFGNHFIDNADWNNSIISFFRIFIQFESFWIGNLILINIVNIFPKSNNKPLLTGNSLYM